jgi:hypothetical protein
MPLGPASLLNVQLVLASERASFSHLHEEKKVGPVFAVGDSDDLEIAFSPHALVAVPQVQPPNCCARASPRHRPATRKTNPKVFSAKREKNLVMLQQMKKWLHHTQGGVDSKQI